MKISTKIPVLDEILSGGIEVGSSTVVWCAPFTDGAPMVYQVCASWLENGLPVLYLVNNKRPDIVIEDSMKFGWDLGKYKHEGLLLFIDAYTPVMGVKSEEHYVVGDPLDLGSVSSTLSQALKENRGQNCMFVLDSLSTMIELLGTESLNLVKDLNRASALYDLAPLYLFTEWNYEKEVKQRLLEVCDNVIHISPIERCLAVSDFLTVKKVCGKPVEAGAVPFRYLKPGGVRIFVPKILVTGPYNAGKTTVVHALSKRAVSVDRAGTTVALDFGHLEYKGFYADVFGTVGQQRFDPILEQLGGESFGVILVVDSTKPETFPRAMEMLRKAKVYGLPLVVFANKQDLPGALSPEEVKRRMKLPEDVPVIGTVATEKKNIFEGLELLLDLIFKEIVKGGSVD